MRVLPHAYVVVTHGHHNWFTQRMKKMLPRLSFILGGAASGKSAFAENLMLSSGLRLTYVATAQGLDSETNTKIKLHQLRRGPVWQTVEVPGVLTESLGALDPERPVLLDCATMWLSNRLMANLPLDDAAEVFVEEMSVCPAPLVVVSNEVGQGIVPENAMARSFREAQGRLNIAVARRAELVVQVVAGLPNVLKGQLP